MAYNIKDVAARAGVSPSTVSRVISGSPRISQKTRERVFAVMKELDYHPNAIARSLVKQSSEALGILIPSTVEQFFLNPFFPEVLRGITQVAQRTGYDLMLSTALHGLNDAERLERMIRSRRVDGVILLTSRVKDNLLPVLDANRIPAVLIGRPMEETSVSWVNNDNVRAAYDITAHLLNLGHRRVGFIGGSQEFVVTIDRLNGYRMALEEFGIPFDPQLVVAGEFMEEVGYSGMMRLLALAERPGAVVASDDVLAFGAMRAAGELGYRIPEDMSIAGFNDIPLARLANPPMTTVNVRIYELGQTAARLLIEQMENNTLQSRSVEIGHSLVVRRSCGAWDPLLPYQAAPLHP